MSSAEDSALMKYMKRRRAINRRAAAKARARLKSWTTNVKKMYYEAKSVNTQLRYRCNQLTKLKESLRAAWAAHVTLHESLGHDISELEYSLSLTSDVPTLPLYRSVSVPLPSMQTDDAMLASVRRRHSEPAPTAIHLTLDYDYFPIQFPDDHLPAGPRQGSLSRTVSSSAGAKMSNYVEFVDSENDRRPARQDSDVGHPTKMTLSTSPSSLYCDCSRSDVAAFQTSSLNDDQRRVHRLRSHTNNGDDDLQSLFGDDDWWSSDQSWNWQCGSPSSSVEEGCTSADVGSTSCPELPITSELSSQVQSSDAGNDSCRQQNSFIPLHVECLFDDLSSQ